MRGLTRYTTRVIGLLAMLAGLLVLMGWIFDIFFLKSPVPAAICIILSGLALYLPNTPVTSTDITAQQKADEKLRLINKELESYISPLKESEEKHSILLNSIDEGFCIIEMIFNKQNKLVDYHFLVINQSFEKQTGLCDEIYGTETIFKNNIRYGFGL